MNLRPMRWWDVAEVTILEAQLFTADPWPAEAFWGELAQGDSRVYLVAVDDDHVDGYAGLSCPADARGSDAEVMTIATAAGAQGRGVGRALLGALVEVARQRGAGRVLLEVRADNDAAQALYAAAGFGPVGRRAGYYRGRPEAGGGPSSVDALVLSLPLTGPATPDTVRP